MMRKLGAVLLVTLLAGGAYQYFQGSDSDGFELEEGYRFLYDGDSLSGWRAIGGDASFEAVGEEIVGRRGPGANSFLRTQESYEDFSLKLQMRWDELGNSGVLFRAGQRGGDGRAYGYQYELDHSDRAWSGGIYDEARRGWLADLADNEAARLAIRLHDWNDIEIEVRGASLMTWINGVPAAQVVDGLDSSGFIALQVHSGDSGIMRWRNIRIREFPALTQVGRGIAVAKDWRLEAIDNFDVTGPDLRGDLQGTEGTEGSLTPRRQLDDALVAMQVPACAEPTVIRIRNNTGDSAPPSFAEVSIYADRARGRVVNADGETWFDEVSLEKAAAQSVTAVAVGDALTVTVAEKDVLRLHGAELEPRGQMIIRPAPCQENFLITNFHWSTLTEVSTEVLPYQTLDNAQAPVMSPAQALEAFSVAPGFEVELVAAEPLVEEPVAMAWDEYGRLYVVEMRGYMQDAYASNSEQAVGQVVRLEDTDGDGRMDVSEVFLGGLVNPRAVAVINEGILVGEPPNLWLCELPDRDSLCTMKSRVGGYATDVVTANVEHMENRLLQGLDNWLYNSKSARRLRLIDGELEQREDLPKGQWGITKDDYGRLLYNHNSTWLQADLFAAQDIVSAGRADYPAGLGVNLTELSEVFSVRVNPGVNRAYLAGTLREDGRLHKATGVSGLVAYRGDQFPAKYRGDVFVPEIAGNVVAQFAIEEQNLQLVAKQRLYEDQKWGQRDFLASTDERFRPVDAMNGPDGSLYIIDMYRGIVQHDHFLTDELREQIFQRELDMPIGMGRIWRVRHKDGETALPRVFPEDAPVSELLAALQHSNGWHRDTAQRLLLKPGVTGVREDLEAISLGENTLAALHALWTLQGRGELSHELVMKVLEGSDTQRQLQALRAGRGFLQLADMPPLYASLNTAPEVLRMQLAFVLGDHAGDAGVREHLQNLLQDNLASIYVSQAIVRAVQGREWLFTQELLGKDGLAQQSEPAGAVLAALAKNGYRSLRGDLSSTQSAPAVMLEYLDWVGSLNGTLAWQQVAMLEGLQALVSEDNFTPAALAVTPAIFADGTIGESSPLWNARLKGRAAFTWPGDELAMGLKPLSPEQLQLVAKGEAFYANCAACHGSSGLGIPGLAPALAGASWVTGPSEWLGRIVLQGMNGPLEIDGIIWNGVMPPHQHLAELDDATLAGLMTYVRRSWGNKADPVSVEEVAAIRAASASRDKPWTAPELEAVPFDRGFSRFLGKFSVSFITMTITEEAEGLHMSVPVYGSGLMTQVTDTVFTASAGEETLKLEFVIEDDGSVQKFILFRDGEKIPVLRK